MRLYHLLPALGAFSVSGASTSERRDASNDLPSGWQYKGCFTDNMPSRVLTGSSYSDAINMTEESCISFCNAKGYTVAGLEYSAECYCDYQLGSSAQMKTDSDCSMTCSGDTSQACGAGNRLSVFTNGGAGPVTNPGPPGFQSLGCHIDNVGGRTLPSTPLGATDVSSMTVAKCTSACQQEGFTYAGLEYGGECWCSDDIQNGGTTIGSGCNMPCSGNTSEFCGGSNRLNVYQALWTPVGCWHDNVMGRTLNTSQHVPGGVSNMTIENCQFACQQAGYQLAGLEAAQDCWCGNEITNGGSCAAVQSSCNMPCKGNSAENCGGSNLLNLFQMGSERLTPCESLSQESSGLSRFSSSATSDKPTGSSRYSSATIMEGTVSSSSVASIYTSSRRSSSPVSDSLPHSTSSISSLRSSLSSSLYTTPKASSTSAAVSKSPVQTTQVGTPVYAGGLSSTNKPAASPSTNIRPGSTQTISTTSVASGVKSARSSSLTTSIVTYNPGTSTKPIPAASATSLVIREPPVSGNLACEPAKGDGADKLLNGGFESGINPWSVQDYSNIDSVTVNKEGKAFTGCSQLVVTPGSSGNRRVVITEMASPMIRHTKYALTFYQGRYSADAVGSNPRIKVSVRNQLLLETVACSGPGCNLKGAGGAVYQKHTTTFANDRSRWRPSTWLPMELKMEITWADDGDTTPVLIDDISLLPTYD